VTAATSLSITAPVISVFGSSGIAEPSEARRQAQELGTALARAGFAVATGGYAGVMEAVSRGAAEAGGTVFGVVARALPGKPNPWVQRVIEVDTWEQRLFRLITLGDAYVACPGATGTLVELAVAWEMMNKGLLGRRPLVALGEFWRPILEQIEAADARTRGWVAAAESVPAALEILQRLIPPPQRL
jgi:uncharacterized protein (TIGR00725 family)